jgi:hypothetical protein
VPSGTGSKRDDPARDARGAAVHGRTRSASDTTGSCANASGRADTARAAVTPADRRAGSGSAVYASYAEHFGTEVRHTSSGAADAAPDTLQIAVCARRYRSFSSTRSVTVRRSGAN